MPERRPGDLLGAASPDALACALAEATGAGYSVQTAEAGVFFNAEQRRAGDFSDRLNVSLARNTLRVLATTEEENATRQSVRSPSSAVRRDAAALVARCTGTP